MKLGRMSIGYNELALLVNESYSKTGDVDLTLKEVRKVDRNLTREEVLEMIGFGDLLDFKD